ncbi:hypothetical protein PS723_02383 [Pseudomonas fluorescens]|uniref:Uncharacterized protein n=1 Tax=Pseudomonas fluorescens TaxID=294 RepID=A0A5E7BYX8_PSEFL|nr:hypothetical protein PS723_02383 [Pseudomonas fluorescens]
MIERPQLSMQDLESAALGSRWPLTDVLDALPWNSDGLIAAIARNTTAVRC